MPNGADTSSRLFFNYSSASPTAAQMTAIAAQWQGLLNSDLGALLSNNITQNQVVATDLGTSTGLVGISGTPHIGSRTGAGNPVQVCALIDYKIARRYRGGKPRGYWPYGISSDVVTENTWSASFQSTLNTQFGAAIASMTGSSTGVNITQHVNVSYYSGFTTYTGSGGRPKTRATLRATPLVDPVVTHDVNPFLGTQRRRVVPG